MDLPYWINAQKSLAMIHAVFFGVVTAQQPSEDTVNYFILSFHRYNFLMLNLRLLAITITTTHLWRRYSNWQ